MKNLKKRRTARTIAAVVVLLGTILGMNLSVARQTKRLEAQFYDGVYLKDEKYTEPGIEAHLQNMVRASGALSTVAANHDPAAEEYTALQAARQQMTGAATIGEKSAAYRAARSAFEDALARMEALTLDEQEAAIVASAKSSFQGAESAIAKSAYNARVGGFLEGDLGEFPVSLLQPLLFVRLPEQF